MSFDVVSKISLDLRDWGEFLHIYTLSVLASGCLLAFCASFADQAAVDEAYGDIRVVSLGKGINSKTQPADLEIRCYEPDEMHQNDIIAPSWKV